MKRTSERQKIGNGKGQTALEYMLLVGLSIIALLSIQFIAKYVTPAMERHFNKVSFFIVGS